MSRCLRFTKKVVMITARAAEPFASIETAINCELPANTMNDIKAIWNPVMPAFCAKTPNARPMGIYPRQMGQAALTPGRIGYRIIVLLPFTLFMGHGCVAYIVNIPCRYNIFLDHLQKRCFKDDCSKFMLTTLIRIPIFVNFLRYDNAIFKRMAHYFMTFRPGFPALNHPQKIDTR
jgi:hypothetical protein